MQIFQNTTSRQDLIRALDGWDISLFLILVVSIIFNTLLFLTMQNKRMKKTRASLFLSVMAISDVSVLLFKCIASLLKIYKVKVYYFCILIQNVIPDVTALTSYWLILIITFERFVAVSNPLEVRIIFSKKRSKFIIASTIVFFAILTNNQVFCLKYGEMQPQFCLIKGLQNETCFYYLRTVYPWIKSALVCWIPSLIGIILNSLIILKLYKASKLREKMSRQKKRLESSAGVKFFKENQITIMLCTISISSVILTLPFSVFELLRKMNVNMKSINVRVAQRAVLLPLDILHTTNFIFCLSGKKFRDSLKDLFTSKQKITNFYRYSRNRQM